MTKITQMTDLEKWIAELESAPAWKPMIDWVKSLPADTTPQQAWSTCEVGEWMLWEAVRGDIDEKIMHLIFADCGELVLHVFEDLHPNNPRARNAIEARRQYAKGNIGANELEAAWHAAWRAGWYDIREDAWKAEEKPKAEIVRKYLPTIPTAS